MQRSLVSLAFGIDIDTKACQRHDAIYMAIHDRLHNPRCIHYTRLLSLYHLKKYERNLDHSYLVQSCQAILISLVQVSAQGGQHFNARLEPTLRSDICRSRTIT
jgi:hypothetical protein